MALPSDFPQQKLERALERVLKSQHSDFYRARLPASLPPLDMHGWRALPFLTRAELAAVPFWERVYVPRSDIQFIRHTSGTSGRHILVSPRNTFGSYEEPFASIPCTRIMSFLFHGYHDFPHSEVSVPLILGDAGDLEFSARIARQAGVDALYMTPQTALVFGEVLRRSHMHGNIRAVILSGERCSPLQYETLKTTYPNAVIFGVYASSETREAAGYACVHERADGGSLVLEPSSELWYEIVDERGQAIDAPGVTGELVVTTLSDTVPFPMIRYRTGDMARFTSRTCVCARERRGFEVLGRVGVFPVRVSRGEITADACEAAIASLPEIPRAYFEARYREAYAGASVLPSVTFVLLRPSVVIADCADRIAQNFFIAPGYSYARGVGEGLYAPLSISWIDAAPLGPTGKVKAPIVVRHIEGSSEPPQMREVARI